MMAKKAKKVAKKSREEGRKKKAKAAKKKATAAKKSRKSKKAAKKKTLPKATATDPVATGPVARLLPPANSVTVRMYRIGHGDCFLLAFATADPDKPVYVLIDCGYKPGSPAFINTTAREIGQHIVAATGGRVHVAVITHEHQDHVNGITETNFDRPHHRRSLVRLDRRSGRRRCQRPAQEIQGQAAWPDRRAQSPRGSGRRQTGRAAGRFHLVRVRRDDDEAFNPAADDRHARRRRGRRRRRTRSR